MMKKLLYTLIITLGTSMQIFSQEAAMNPENNTADKSLIKNETSEMTWFMLNDSLKIEIGKIHTQIQKEEEKIYIITTVVMKESPSKWIDSTIVKTVNLKPLYHSSYNQQRDMVLNFEKKVTGYYLDKKTGIKKQISEETEKSFFDSNFYPQLIRWLPLTAGYSNIISIFDYNPKANTGVITATIINTVETTVNFNGNKSRVWKVDTTDEISNNTTVSTYYIDMKTRKTLKQEIDFGGRKMSIELVK